MPTTVFLSLGTNLGDKRANIEQATKAIAERLGCVTKRSKNYESEPWGFSSENQFLNAVIEVETSLSATETLDTLIEIEQQMGRTHKSKNGIYADRIIDIDILIFGNEIIENERLKVPHPLMAQRAFVLQPFCEIAPERLHPTLHKTVQQLYTELKSV